jgi:hypothetical protein
LRRKRNRERNRERSRERNLRRKRVAHKPRPKKLKVNFRHWLTGRRAHWGAHATVGRISGTTENSSPVLETIMGLLRRGIHLPVEPTLAHLRSTKVHRVRHVLLKSETCVAGAPNEVVAKLNKGWVVGRRDSLENDSDQGKDLAGLSDTRGHLQM